MLGVGGRGVLEELIPNDDWGVGVGWGGWGVLEEIMRPRRFRRRKLAFLSFNSSYCVTMRGGGGEGGPFISVVIA